MLFEFVVCTVLTATAVSAYLATIAGPTLNLAVATNTAAAGGVEAGAGAAGAVGTELTVPLLPVGTTIAGTIACCKLFLRLAKYAEWFNKVESECKKKLNFVRDNLDELERKVKVVEEELEESAQ